MRDASRQKERPSLPVEGQLDRAEGKKRENDGKSMKSVDAGSFKEDKNKLELCATVKISLIVN